MRAPGFWAHPPDRPGLAARVLSPLGALYAAGTARRIARGPEHRPGVPVICVGNINAGGTGKTPLCLWLQARLQQAGYLPHVISRGYGGTAEGPVRVDPTRHSAAFVGDEPLLMAAFGPVWVGKDRAASARQAEAAGATVLILDDGFQNPALAKDISIVVVDAARGFGNGRVLPAGPLREPVSVGLARADIVLSVGPDTAQTRFDRAWSDQVTCPRLRGALVPLETGMDWTRVPVVAFAGIGHPEKFFATLTQLGCDIRDKVALGDHQDLSAGLLSRLVSRAEALSAQLVTTEKDAVRLPPGLRGRVMVVPVRLVLQDDAPLRSALEKHGILLDAKA